MRHAAAAAALALLAACGGDAKPRATPSPSAPALPAEAKAVRDVVAKTLAACPCAVEVWVGAPESGLRVTLRGVYDAKAQTAELREFGDDGKDTGIVLRLVDGRAFLDPDLGTWFELDFSGLPKKPVSPLGPLAVADPRVSFAVAAHVTTAAEASTTDGVTLHDVAYDLAAARPTMGAWGGLMDRLMPEPSVYDKLMTRNGLLYRMTVEASGGAPADDDLGVTLTVTKTGVAAPPVAVPQTVRMVDVANEAIGQ